MMDSTLWLLLVAGLAAGWTAWLVQHALYLALERHRQLYTTEAEHRLRDLFVFVDLKLLWPAAGALGLVLGLVVVLLGLGLITGVIIAAVCWAMPNVGIWWAKRQRIRAFEAQLPDALSSLSAAIKAGASLSTAMQALVHHALPPLSQEFSVVNRQIRLGAGAADAVQQMATRIGGDSLKILSVTLRVAIQTGGPMAAMLEQTGDTLLASQQLKARLSALTSQGWMQAWVMAAMPLALMAALSALDPMFGEQLLHSEAGHLVLGAVGLFEALGMWWLRKTTTIQLAG